jgi:hypothetical protein
MVVCLLQAGDEVVREIVLGQEDDASRMAAQGLAQWLCTVENTDTKTQLARHRVH